MTNRDLLQTSKQVLTALDRQRQFLLQVDGTPKPAEPIHITRSSSETSSAALPVFPVNDHGQGLLF
jgi:hypothetical protein